MKKILVAGGTGFIGYHIAKKALEKNYKVISISKNPPSNKRFLKKVKYIYSDLSKKNIKIILEDSLDYVVNCAGYGKHLKYNLQGRKLYEQHINILINLTNLINNKNLKKFIQMGSSLEYSENKKKLKENFDCTPNSIYGQAKLACTQYLTLLHKNINLPVTIFRVFQVYGPRQDQNRLIPYVINKCKKNQTFALTSGEQVRNFCYIDDFVEAIFRSLREKKSNGEIFNIGSDSAHKVKQVVKLIRNLIGKGKPIFGKKKKHIGEKNFISPNIMKIKKILKWQPKHNLLGGIKKMILD